MQIGNRIFYDQKGEIIYQTGEMQGDVLPRKEITELNYVDLEYGAIDLTKQRIVSIDPVTKRPVLEAIETPPTPEQQQIKNLEDQLLILADQSTGGIL
ncbi:hypothetical protein [Paenibacillus tuaregi]|uniref:hypothetical protein n=1 Tax=Paenibacillus tuaregi TaxID=1816681 RepID=UPI000B04D682|nr:hypothetical protein [Paenibacillus tuaregi]